MLDIDSNETVETVRIYIAIEIDTSSFEDTGITVAAWNAMTDAERSAVVQPLWNDAAANADHGGMSVVTDGAEDI